MKTNRTILLLLITILLIETVLMVVEKEVVPAILFTIMLCIAVLELIRLYR